ncbi:MAG: hypothetical protein WBF58_01215 [Xanthobacteraceae bacterium]
MKLFNTNMIWSAVAVALLTTPAFAYRVHHRHHPRRHYAFTHRAPHYYRSYRGWAPPTQYPSYPGTAFGANGNAYAVPTNEGSR